MLQQIASRIPGGGRILTWLAGAAWTLATIFVVPVLVVESEDAIPAVRRSASLIKQRWGEGIAGSLTIGAWLIVATIPACIVLVAGVGLAHSEPAVASVLIAVGAVAIVAIAAAASAMREIFALALYCYAVDGEVRVFAPGDLDQPFSGRGKRATTAIRLAANASPGRAPGAVLMVLGACRLRWRRRHDIDPGRGASGTSGPQGSGGRRDDREGVPRRLDPGRDRRGPGRGRRQPRLLGRRTPTPAATSRSQVAIDAASARSRHADLPQIVANNC